MKKVRVRSSSILDKLHRGVVYTCIAVTLYGTFHLGWRFHHYFTETRPERQRLEMQKLQESNLNKEDLDKAPELKY